MSSVEDITEFTKCVNNPFYYYENNFHGMNYLLKRYEKLKLTNSQKKFLKSAHKSSDITVLKNRQIGVSFAISLYVSWVLLHKPNKNIVVLSCNRASSDILSGKVNDILQQSKSFNSLNYSFKKTKIIHNLSQVKFVTNSSELRCSSPDILIIDEACYVEGLEEILSYYIPMIKARCGQIIVSSTIGGLREREFIKFYNGRIKSALFLKKEFLPEKIGNIIYNENCEVLNFTK